MVSEYENLYTNFGISTGDMGEASIYYQRKRINLRDLILDKGSMERDQYVSLIEEYDKRIQEELDRFSKTLETEEGKQEFAQLRAAMDKYAPIQDRIIDLAISGQEEQALSVLRNEGKALADEINDTIDRLFENKIETGLVLSEQYSASSKTTVKTMIAIVAFAMAAAVVLGIFISRLIGKPVKSMVEVAERIADGDLNVSVNINTKDEIGTLAAVFRKMANNLNEVISNISAASEQVASGSKQMSDSSIALSQGATEQASSIEELTASLEEISSQTRLNADNATRANELAEAAKVNAELGNRQMQDMLKAMEEINDSSSNISKIIKVIDEIAFQTNILALNAAVEAARAGQHGKGFAVVAEEVRNLAARSANAAKETTDMIEGSIKKTEGGTKIANETAKALNEIVDNIGKVAELVNGIAIASNEQASGIAQINQGVMQVSQVVQTNSATAEESAAASEELSGQAALLREMVGKFKLKKGGVNGSKLDELNPEVLRMLEGMAEKKAGVQKSTDTDEAAAASKTKIALSDKEFGKY